ncbi:monocarboxylate transporter 5-like [Ischnura elegans]|uniref:monocarboxylate transporter 5-like n=1 Tax=Ischnura elegans TaxID=197161 RepID=UPI001ED88249|nr:monocarboxylate transporter 5-like [Ischnura elegans]
MAPHGGAEADEEGEGQLEDSAFVKPKRRKGQDATPAMATEPPEGGWGWMVAIGMAVMFVSTTGQYGSFALLFDGFLTQLGQETTGATLIMNAFTAAFNFTGLVTNHMLTRMSYRKVALLGGALFTTGILLTTFARTMAHALVTYSVLAGVGFGLIAPSSFLAFNSYFLRRRGFAMGICQAGIGLGFMASPPIITYLIREYSFSGTMLILSGVALHSLLGAALYQPIKWHMRKVPPSNGHAIVSEATDGQPTTKLHSKLADPTSMEEVEARQPLAMDCPAHDPSREPQSRPPLLRCAGDGPALLLPAASLPSIPKEWEEGQLRCYQRQSASLVNLGTIVLVLNNNSDLHTTCTASVDMQQKKSVAEGEREQEAKNRKSKRHTTARTMGGKLRSAWRRLLRRNEEGSGRSVLGFVVDFLDLRLLKDPSYVNLALGLSVSCLSDTNFFTVLPFHLQRTLGFSPADVAVCLSAAAGADVASRLLLPLLGDHLRLQKRTAYLLGCLTSAIARSIFVLVEDFPSVVAFCALVGFLKGTMVVNLALTIAEHCCLEKFAAAFGLYMIMSGIITISLGPLIGVVRDWSESYELCIHVLSGVLLLCAIPWLLEMAVVRWRKRRKPAL